MQLILHFCLPSLIVFESFSGEPWLGKDVSAVVLDSEYGLNCLHITPNYRIDRIQRELMNLKYLYFPEIIL